MVFVTGGWRWRAPLTHRRSRVEEGKNLLACEPFARVNIEEAHEDVEELVGKPTSLKSREHGWGGLESGTFGQQLDELAPDARIERVPTLHTPGCQRRGLHSAAVSDPLSFKAQGNVLTVKIIDLGVGKLEEEQLVEDNAWKG